MTGISLAQHPLSIKLQSCDTVEAVNNLLQEKAQAFRHFPGSDKIMKSIKMNVSILSKVSSAASLNDAFDLVRQKGLRTCLKSLTFILRPSHLQRRYRLVSLSYLTYVPLSSSYVRWPGDVHVVQSAKGIISNCDALVELLESIEHVLNPLNIYTQIPPTPAMGEIVLKIQVELISTLGLMTKQLKQGRSSEPILADVVLCSAPCKSNLERKFSKRRTSRQSWKGLTD